MQMTQQPGDAVTQQADDTETIAHSDHHLTHEFSRSSLRTPRGFVGFENRTLSWRGMVKMLCVKPASKLHQVLGAVILVTGRVWSVGNEIRGKYGTVYKTTESVLN